MQKSLCGEIKFNAFIASLQSRLYIAFASLAIWLQTIIIAGSAPLGPVNDEF